MKEKFHKEYVKRAQKNYSMSFKLQVVNEVERGEFDIKAATHKSGIQGNHTVTTSLRKSLRCLFDKREKRYKQKRLIYMRTIHVYKPFKLINPVE